MTWKTSFPTSRPTSSRRPAARRLQLAELEAREVPATLSWSGASTSFWSHGANWVGGVAPVAGDDLVFPAGPAQKIVINDLADGISFASIQIEDAGYHLLPDSGGPHSVVLTGGFTTTYNTGSAISGLDVQLDSGAVTVAAGGSLSFTGVVSGAAGLTLSGGGALELFTANTFSGTTTVTAGTLQLAVTGAVGGGDIVVASGAALELADNVDVGVPITVSGTGVGGAGAIYVPSGLGIVSGDVTLGAAARVGAGAGAALAFTGAIDDGASAFDFEAQSDPTGTVILQASNLFGGDVHVREGRLQVNTSGTLGDPAANSTVFVEDGASLELAGGVTLPAAKTLALSGLPAPGTSKIVASGDNTIQGDVGITGGNNVAFDVAGGSTLTVSGTVSGALDFDKNNAGTLILTGTNTHAGAVNVWDGTLLVNGSLAASSSVFVDGVLGGSGTVPAVTVSGIGTLAPGQGGAGVLTTGTVALNSGSTFIVDLNGTAVDTQYDRANALGAVSLNGGGVSFNLGFSPVSGNSFTILTNDGADAVAGTFNGLAEGATFTAGGTQFRITYAGGDGNDVALTALGATTTALAPAPNPSVFGQTVTLTATVTGTGATPAGTVEFYDGTTLLGTAPLDAAGQAALTVSSLAVGSHTLRADYLGQGSDLASSSTNSTQTVNQASSTTTLATSPDPSVFGEAKTLTATVTAAAPGAGTPTGTVDFFDGATLLGSAPLVGGAATLTTSTLGVGSHSLTAVFSGDADFTGGTSPVDTATVTQAGTTTTLTTAPDPSVFGEAVTMTATVAVDAPGAGTPAGTVSFFDGATLIGTAAVSGGAATLTTSSLSVGTHSITAVYSGDADFTGSTSPVDPATVTQAATTATAVSVPDPSVFGEAVTVVATVSAGAPATGTPTGTVSFFDGAVLIGSAPLDASGQAAMTTTALSVGSHSITAVYSGDTGFTASTSPVDTHAVSQAATTTTLTTAPDPAVFGEAVTLTAAVAAVAPGAGTAAGTVSFIDGATLLGSVPLVGGAATLTTSTLAVGSHSLTAVFSGDADFTGSTSAVATATVNQAGTTTTLSTAPGSTVFGEATTLTATVAADAPGAGTPTGTVSFFDGATLIGTATVSGGTATLTTTALGVGAHSLSAVYTGDTNFTGSTGAVAHAVAQAPTTMTLTPAAGPVFVGRTFTLTATVSAVAPGAGTATGSVAFYDGATLLGTAALAAGQAAFDATLYGAGVHTITATYVGDPNFTGATAAVARTVRMVDGDVNNDGYADTVVGQLSPGSKVTVFSGAPSAGERAALATLTPFGKFQGGAHAALADVNGDGYADVVVGSGAGGKARVVVYDGQTIAAGTPQVIADFIAFPQSPNGVRVAAADVDGDGKADVVAGGTNRVKVFSGADLSGQTLLADFLPYGPTSQAGIRVAAADVDGDGKADVVTGAGPGASHAVKVFRGTDFSVLTTLRPFAGETSGTAVAAADVDGDGKADVIVGSGTRVKVFSGADDHQIASFPAFGGTADGSVRVAARDVDGDGKADIIVGTPSAFAPRVKVFGGADQTELDSFLAYSPTFRGGVTVG